MSAAEKTTTKPVLPYSQARLHRPEGACYCDLPDEDCYLAGHWHCAPREKCLDCIGAGYGQPCWCDAMEDGFVYPDGTPV